MNPLAIYQGLAAAVEDSPFAASIGVEFGFDAMGFEPQHRFQLTVKPGDGGNTVGAADAELPMDSRFVAIQHWLTTIRLEVDDSSSSEADQWQACASLRNFAHAELLRLMPAGRMEIVSQSYDRVQSRANSYAILMVVRTSEWLEKNEDRGIEEILAKGEVTQRLLDLTEVYDVPA
jgi:hypothetical protein